MANQLIPPQQAVKCILTAASHAAATHNLRKEQEARLAAMLGALFAK
jgi:hypothetical protein